MTANQIILLLDIYRGFNRDLHTGTLARDLEVLKSRELIAVHSKGLGYSVTHAGSRLCLILRDVTSLKN